MTSMWLFPLLTLGVVSVMTFVQGAITALVTWTWPGMAPGDLWFPLLLMGVGVVGMTLTIRLTPER
jgi:hypothetical protein